MSKLMQSKACANRAAYAFVLIVVSAAASFSYVAEPHIYFQGSVTFGNMRDQAIAQPEKEKPAAYTNDDRAQINMIAASIPVSSGIVSASDLQPVKGAPDHLRISMPQAQKAGS